MYYGFDPTFILLVPALLLSIYAQFKIQGTFSKFLRVRSYSGYTGAQAARKILDSNGLYDVPIEVISGHLTDHYDPSHRVLRLSYDVYYGDSLASIGVAAHEAGHALQHHEGYAPLQIRNSLVPVANIGSNLSWILVIAGFALGLAGLINLGILLFSAAVLFQIITLPVEFNASSRALKQIEDNGILYREEIGGAKKVLSAAALTYVAATIMAVSQLLRLLVIARERDE
jgi:Zn-dependent membrane protease YugP